jgi:hypothetical protein
MADDHDFSKEPLTPGERRALKAEAADKWSPRDLLIHMLREHDAGRCVLQDVVVCWHDGTDFGFWNASKESSRALGLLAIATHGIADGSRKD